MRTLRTVFDLFPAAGAGGLTPADVAASRGRFGANRLTPLPRDPVWQKFLAKFDEPIIKILLAASLLKIAVDLVEASAAVGGAAIGAVVLAVGAAYLLRLGGWVPALLFALAAALFGLSAGLGRPSVEGLAVMVAVGLATGVGFLSEYRSDREFDALNAHKDAVRVKALRAGKVQAIPLEDVVVGDLVVLEAGDEVPADARVAKATGLLVDQSLMTGESEPVKKGPGPADEPADGPDRPGCVYRGTQVVDGLGEVVVANVGDDTMLGQLARRLSGDAPGQADEAAAGDEAGARVQRKLTLARDLTPLQRKLGDLADLISKVGYVAAGAIFLALVVRGAVFADPPEVFVPRSADQAREVAAVLLRHFLYMVIVVVVAVPEGLPMSVTVSLALAMRKMTRANALVRQLVATETIGSATVICSDKTGTLTRNQMRVVRVGVGGQTAEDGTPEFAALAPAGATVPPAGPADWVGLNAAVNSTATLEDKDGKTVVVGNSTEGALLHWLREAGADAAAYRLEYPAEYRAAFSSDLKRMTTVTRLGGRPVALVKGAPEVILDRCSKVLARDGATRDMTPADREAVRAGVGAAAGQAMRTLAFAHAELPPDWAPDPAADGPPDLARDLVFAGFVAIRDPVRADVPGAVAECRAAGIGVKMITGDNVDTAAAVAREAGLFAGPHPEVLTSDQIAGMADDDLRARLPRLAVLARARPLDKYRLVRLLQDRGEVVAMTGDGTNDAPSLKQADVGLAMGVAGTEVAKEASKIVLLDDSFGTIVKAVHWGRALYENIQRFVQFQLTINVSALAIAFLCPLVFGFEPPFTVLQLLWINVIMDTFAAVALCSEPPRPGLMRAPPKRRDESILTPAMATTILLTGGFFVAVMLGLLGLMAGSPDAPGLFGAGGPDAAWLARTADGDREAVPAAALARAPGGGWEAAGRPVEVHFTVYQATLFFTVYVFFQVWNQINCRSLTPDVSGLWGLGRNPYFLLIASLTVVGQVLIVSFGGRVFDVEPLAVRDWVAVAGATASVLVFAEAARLARKVAGRAAGPGPV